MKKILLVGSGNLATHLALNINKKEYLINQVYSPNKTNAKDLSNKIKSEWTSDPKEIKKADITIIAIKDDEIKNIIKILPKNPTVHTSGSTNINVFKGYFSDYGVLYPLQSFKKDIKINMKNVPFLIEANNKQFEKELFQLASSLSKITEKTNSYKRKKIHVAAIFACNFSNHMLVIAKQLLEKENIDYKFLLPLIKESFSRIDSTDPLITQTGPAVRKDIKIIEEHLESIDQDEFKELYKLISNNIIKTHDNSY